MTIMNALSTITGRLNGSYYMIPTTAYPTISSIPGIDSSRFDPGQTYELDFDVELRWTCATNKQVYWELRVALDGTLLNYGYVRNSNSEGLCKCCWVEK